MYKEIKFTISNLHNLIKQELGATRKIFYRDLCFSLKDVPIYEIYKLTNN